MCLVLKDRQKSILKAAIEGHIKTAHPIASQEIVRNFKLGLSPATIRNEMLALDELGYLKQPHTSAGRVPTDQGYRFFVDNLISEVFLSEKETQLINETFSIENEEKFIKEFGGIVSEISSMFTMVGTFEEDLFYETGFSKIMGEPEFYNQKDLKTFGQLVDFLGEEMLNFFHDEIYNLDGYEGEKILIGDENPLKEARSYSMILSSWQHPQGFRGFFTMLGPKRTNYSKHKAVINNIKKHDC